MKKKAIGGLKAIRGTKADEMSKQTNKQTN